MYVHEIGRIPAEPHGAAATAPMPPPSGPHSGTTGWLGQVRREVLAHRDRADARPSPAVRDAERLVQVEVRHVGAERARRREPDERVEVRAVDVHLAAVLVHDRAHVDDPGLEHAVGRRVRRHQRAEPVRVLGRLLLEVVEVDVAVVVGRDDHDRACRPSTALAAFVPCADAGIRQTSRCSSPRSRWYARIASRPASSPCEPAFGCSDTAA